MDAELLEQLQRSGSRIRVGGQVGTVVRFRTGRKGTITVDRGEGDIVEVAAQDFGVVDPVDPGAVAAMQAQKEQEALGFQIARSIATQTPLLP